MAVQRFATTRLSDLRAVGQVNHMQYGVITSFLERELGARHARLFADFEAESSDVRSWYAEADRPPRPLDALSLAAQEQVRQEVARLIGDITRLAETLAAGTTQQANLARTILAATTFPAEDIWVDGDQPIIVNWGFHRHDVAAGPPGFIIAKAPSLRTSAEAPPHSEPAAAAEPAFASIPVLPPRAASRAGRHAGLLAAILLWLCLAAILATLYAILLPACGIRGLTGGSCPARDDDRYAKAAEEGVLLQRLVQQAELEAAQQRQLCQLQQVQGRETPRPPPNPVPPPQEFANRIHQDVRPTTPDGTEVELVWDNKADLDLIILCPDGGKLSQASPGRAACGGNFKQDVNYPGAAGSVFTDKPAELATWPGMPPPGRYTIQVELYDYNMVAAGTDIPFTVRVKKPGAGNAQFFSGHVSGAKTIVDAAEVTF